MNKLTAIILGACLIVAVILGFAYFGHKNYGVISGVTNTGNYMSVGGVNYWAYRQGLFSATTTVCAIQSPAATSSLVSGGMVLNSSTTTGITVTMAKAATAYATTTMLATSTVAANALATLSALATTSYAIVNDVTEAVNDRIFNPSQWFVIGVAGNSGTSFSPSGYCTATFQEF